MLGDQQISAIFAPSFDVRELNLADVIIGEQDIRASVPDDGIDELALDIQCNGLLQPIGVRVRVEGGYQLLWGSRRVAAFGRLGRTTIPARVYTADQQTVKSIALRENILRRDLTLQQECTVVADLYEGQARSVAHIARLVGKSVTWVHRRLAIPSLPLDLRGPVYDGAISIGAAEALAEIEDESARRYVTSVVISSNASIAQVGQLVAAALAAPSLGQAIDEGVDAALNQPRSGEIHCPCAACQQLTPLARLVILRLCAGCAHIVTSDPASALVATTPERSDVH